MPRCRKPLSPRAVMDLQKVLVALTWEAEAESVFVAGDFTSWDLVSLSKEGIVWRRDFEIEPGCYAHKFVVDGKWVNKEDAELEKDAKGNWNGLLIVEEEDDIEENASNNVDSLTQHLENASLGEVIPNNERTLELITLETFDEDNSVRELSPHREDETVKDQEIDEKHDTYPDEAKEEIRLQPGESSVVGNAEIIPYAKEITTGEYEPNKPEESETFKIKDESKIIDQLEKNTKQQDPVNAEESSTREFEQNKLEKSEISQDHEENKTMDKLDVRIKTTDKNILMSEIEKSAERFESKLNVNNKKKIEQNVTTESMDKIEEVMDHLTIDDDQNKLKKSTKGTRVMARRRTIAVTPMENDENIPKDLIVKKAGPKDKQLHPDDVESPRRVTRNVMKKLANNN